MKLLERFPILLWAGGALLGWVAGDIMAKDGALLHLFSPSTVEHLHIWAAVAGAVFVVAVGLILRRRSHGKEHAFEHAQPVSVEAQRPKDSA
jgi:predicted tellurium resistance membrane protein TerC